jgi:hypothetical protein
MGTTRQLNSVDPTQADRGRVDSEWLRRVRLPSPRISRLAEIRPLQGPGVSQPQGAVLDMCFADPLCISRLAKGERQSGSPSNVLQPVSSVWCSASCSGPCTSASISSADGKFMRLRCGSNAPEERLP